MLQTQMPESEKKYVLIVDDSITVRKIIAKQLGDEYITFHADNGDEAWQILQSNNAVSLVFLDLHMPVMNGMMLLKQMRSSENDHIAKLPVIMITGHKDSEAARKASRNMGATDFIGKPFTAADITSRARKHAKSAKPATLHVVKPTCDSLTDLLNRQGFQQEGERVYKDSVQQDLEISILLMQIKDIDELASTYSEEIANQIVLSVTRSIKNTLRTDDLLAYLGTGQFAVLLSNTNAFKAHIIAMRIQNAVKKLLFKFNDKTINIEIAVGLNSGENYADHLTFSELCVQTEQALHASLQHKDCKIIRRAELFPEVPYFDISNNGRSGSSFEKAIRQETPPHRENSDIDKLCSYMPAIMKGEFEKIPPHVFADMIKPLQSCLDYAHNQLHIRAE